METVSDNWVYPTLNLIGFSIVLIINFLANSIPLGGNTTGEISSRYPNSFVPAGYVFSIWGIIYLLNGIFVIYGFTAEASENQIYQSIKLWYFVISILNVSWLFAWHYEKLTLSSIIMITFLLSLIWLYDILQINSTELEGNENIALHLTFSVYLAWISAATVANITILLKSYEWDGFGISEEVWTVLLLSIILILTIIMILVNHDIIFGLVIIWAFLGIYVSQKESLLISYSTIGSIIAIILVSIFENSRN